MLSINQGLIFKIDGVLYAIDSDMIGKIIHIPEITKIPLTHKSVAGIAAVEGEIITVYDAYQLITKKEHLDQSSEKARLFTIKHGRLNVGILVEEVINNITIDESLIEGSDDDSEDHIEGYLKNDDGIIQIVSFKKLLSHVNPPVFEKVAIADMNVLDDQGAAESEDETQLLTFKIENEYYAIRTDLVREIIQTNYPVTTIADSKKEIIGMITLRNHVVSAIDLRIIMGMKGVKNDKNRYILA
jgi:purine-binding chemotaxis protein CheW